MNDRERIDEINILQVGVILNVGLVKSLGDARVDAGDGAFVSVQG